MSGKIQIVLPSVKLMTPPPELESAARHIERAGRTCYKSEKLITSNSANAFVQRIIKSGHESVIEHRFATFRFTGSRTMSHQLVRHRIGSYSQESQRYCTYGKSAALQVVPPSPVVDADGPLDPLLGLDLNRASLIAPYPILNNNAVFTWLTSCMEAYESYRELLDIGWRPEDAREVLPNCTKTEVVVTFNLRQWRWFFEKRCDKHAQKQIRELALAALQTLHSYVPAVFQDQYDKFIKTAPSAQTGDK